MISKRTAHWYARFRGRVGCIGHDAEIALDLARAMARGEDDETLAFVWEYDDDPDLSWMDDRARKDFRDGRTEMLACRLTKDGKTIDYLGGIHVLTRGEEIYKREIEADMLREHYASVDSQNAGIRSHVESVLHTE